MKKIAVIFGGASTEHDVSIVSGASVIRNLNQNHYTVEKIYISKEKEWYICHDSAEELAKLQVGETVKNIEKIENPIEELKKYDCIFPVLHGLYGEDGSIQGLLEMLQIPYVGCHILASSICMDKAYTKVILEKAKIKQAKYVYIQAYEKGTFYYVTEEYTKQKMPLTQIMQKIENTLSYPMFIKPCNSGSSVGVTKAENTEELEKAILIAAKYDVKILIEQGIKGREVECAVLGNENPKASCIGEVLSAEDFYTFDSKYHNQQSRTQIPADLPENISEQIRNIAIKAFEAVDAKGLARVDFFVEEKTNAIILNEINTMPGFTQISMYPKLWEASGSTYTRIIR